MKANKFPIIDLHDDFVLACYEKGRQFKSERQINLKLMKKTNVKVMFGGFSYDNYFKDTNLQLEVMLKQVKNKKNNLLLIKNKKNLLEVVKSSSKIGIILHLEGAGILDTKMVLFNKYYNMGLRSISLTHSEKNHLASGNKSNPKEHITRFGKKVIKEAIKRNMIIDLAHLNYAGFFDVLKLTENQPPIVTHTCTFEICPDPRNLKDDQIKEISKRNGLIGIFFSAKYVKKNFKATTIDNVVKHFIHVAKIGGVDILAIGSDFGGITTGLPKGLENIGKFGNLIKKLKNAGFSNQDLEKIAYLNAYRVLNQILK